MEAKEAMDKAGARQGRSWVRWESMQRWDSIACRSRAQARFLEIWKSGTWTSGNLGSQKIQKIRILKIKIRSAQNVGKVWIGRKKSSWPHLGPPGPIFCLGRQNAKTY